MANDWIPTVFQYGEREAGRPSEAIAALHSHGWASPSVSSYEESGEFLYHHWGSAKFASSLAELCSRVEEIEEGVTVPLRKGSLEISLSTDDEWYPDRSFQHVDVVGQAWDFRPASEYEEHQTAFENVIIFIEAVQAVAEATDPTYGAANQSYDEGIGYRRCRDYGVALRSGVRRGRCKR